LQNPKLTLSLYKGLLQRIHHHKHQLPELLLLPMRLCRCLDLSQGLGICQRQQPQARQLLQPAASGPSGQVQIPQAVR
jgi:hypothetical protein